MKKLLKESEMRPDFLLAYDNSHEGQVYMKNFCGLNECLSDAKCTGSNESFELRYE